MRQKHVLRKYKSGPPRYRRNLRRVKIAVGILMIIAISSYDSIPIPDFIFGIRNFMVDNEIQQTGKAIAFQFEVMGDPQKAHIIFGDGSVQDLLEIGYIENAVFKGVAEHSYLLQGEYTPILQIWDGLGKRYSESLGITIQNDAPLFDLSIDGRALNLLTNTLKSSSSPEYCVVEDQEVRIMVSNITSEKDVTFIYDFGDSQVKSKQNYTTHAWKKSGLYQLTVTVMGAEGELSRESHLVEVVNNGPQAEFFIVSEGQLTVGKSVQFSAEQSNDTKSDLKTLKFTWNFDNETSYYGKKVKHAFQLSEAKN